MYTKENPLVVKDAVELSRMDQSLVKELHASGAIQVGGKPAAPAGDPPPAPPAGDPPPAPSGLNDEQVSQYLSEKLGGKYDVVSILELNQTAQALQQKLTEYESLAQGIANPYANEDIARVNAVVKKTGITDLQTAQRISTEEGVKSLSSEDVLVIEQRIQGVSLPESEIREAIRQKYGYIDDGNYENKSLMNLDAEKAKKTVLGSIEGIDYKANVNLEKIKADGQQKVQENLSRWETDLKIMELRPIDVKIKYGEAEGEGIAVQITGDYIKGKSGQIKSVIAQQGLQPDEAGKKNIQSLIENMYWLENRQSIMSDVAAGLRKKLDAEYTAAGSIQRPGQADTTKKSVSEQLLDIHRAKQRN